MYFAKIESSKQASREYNAALAAQAARRLGTKQHREEKQVSMSWNEKNKWANGALRVRADGTAARTINRKQGARYEARLAAFNRGSMRQGGYIHTHHRPGSVQ